MPIAIGNLTFSGTECKNENKLVILDPSLFKFIIPLILIIGISRKIPIPSSKLTKTIPKRLIIRTFPEKAYNRLIKCKICSKIYSPFHTIVLLVFLFSSMQKEKGVKENIKNEEILVTVESQNQHDKDIENS